VYSQSKEVADEGYVRRLEMRAKVFRKFEVVSSHYNYNAIICRIEFHSKFAAINITMDIFTSCCGTSHGTIDTSEERGKTSKSD
jgi:hypothetical protein